MRIVACDFPEDIEWFSESGTFMSALVPVPETPDSFDKGISCYPNPFNPSTTLVFDLPEALPFNLKIYDLSDKLVRTLSIGQMGNSGRNTMLWNGCNDRGNPVATGSYICRVQAGALHKVGRMLIVQ